MYFENKTPGHYKFYDISLIPNEDNKRAAILVKWGRIGKKGNTKVVFEGPIRAAMRRFSELTNKRRKNGYSEIEQENNK